jgi:hypothetical protein
MYLSVPKAACTSVKWALFQARGLALPDLPKLIHWQRWPERVENVRAACQGLFAFTVLRNPMERLVSCYRNKFRADGIHDLMGDHAEIRIDWSFRQFVEFVCRTPDEKCNEHIASQVHLLSDDKGLLPVNILHIGHLGQQWAPLSLNFGLPQLRRLNTTEGPRHVPSDEVAEMVGHRYSADYELLSR